MAYTYLSQFDSPNFSTPSECQGIWGRPRTIEAIAIHSPFQFVTTDNSWIRVDKKDQNLLDKKWSFSNGYAKRYHEKAVDGKRVRWVEYLHRTITGAKEDEIVDHINGDTTDNRRSNLRVTNKSINALNTPKTKGVYLNKRQNRWYARLTVGGTKLSLGGFATEEEARSIYEKAKKEALCTLS